MRVTLLFLLLSLVNVAQAATAPAFLTANYCEDQLTSAQPMYVRLIQLYIERTRSNPQAVARVLNIIKNSAVPINPFGRTATVFERQMFESLQVEISRNISAEWPVIQKNLTHNEAKEKVENEDRDSRAEETARILSFELAAQSPASDEVWELSTFTQNDRTYVAHASMKSWDSSENETRLFEMNRDTGILTAIAPKTFAGGIESQIARGENNELVLIGSGSQTHSVYHFDEKLNLTSECAFPTAEGMNLIQLRTGKVIAVDYYYSPFTIWTCENGKYIQGAKSHAPGAIKDSRIFQLHGRTYAWGLVPKTDGYPRTIMFEITDDLNFKLIDLEKFPVPVMSIASGPYTPFKATIKPMTEIVRSDENNYFFEEKDGRLSHIQTAPSKGSSQRMGGNSPQHFKGSQHDFIVDTRKEGLYAYRYLKGGSLEIVDHIEMNGESSTLTSWKNPDGRNFVLYMINKELQIFSFDTNSGKFSLDVRIPGLSDVKQKPLMIPGRNGQVFVAIARAYNVEIYLLYKKLETNK